MNQSLEDLYDMNAFHLSPEGFNSLNLCKSMGFHGISKGFSGCPQCHLPQETRHQEFHQTFLLIPGGLGGV